jgi:FixJ family two-component response regulator
MVSPKQAQRASYEADIHLAISALQQDQIQKEAAAAQVYNVSRDTLHRRRARTRAQRDCQPNSKKLTQREEEVIVSYILDLNTRGFAPTYAAVRDIADRLLAARGAGQVGVH